MLIIICTSLALLAICCTLCYTLFSRVRKLCARVKALEEQASEVESLRERGTRRLAQDLTDICRETTAREVNRVDEALKIFDERRLALEDQIKLTRAMTDTMVDAFKYRLDEAEKRGETA